MCKTLCISKAGYYKYREVKKEKDEHTEIVSKIFNDNHKCYGTRRIKKELSRQGIILSRRKIGRIMAQEGLVSNYTVMQYKVHSKGVNNDPIPNELGREFLGRNKLEAVVSDLTYVRVNGKWNYICTLMDLYNREIIGYSCGPNKNAALVEKAFSKVSEDLREIHWFHSDRGLEFKNKLIDKTLSTFGIKRSLSNKGTPYDNAVAESTFKSIKIEFVYPNTFRSLEELEFKLGAYIWWYNHKRLHSTLGYQSPKEYELNYSL